MDKCVGKLTNSVLVPHYRYAGEILVLLQKATPTIATCIRLELIITLDCTGRLLIRNPQSLYIKWNSGRRQQKVEDWVVTAFEYSTAVNHLPGLPQSAHTSFPSCFLSSIMARFVGESDMSVYHCNSSLYKSGFCLQSKLCSSMLHPFGRCARARICARHLARRTNRTYVNSRCRSESKTKPATNNIIERERGHN